MQCNHIAIDAEPDSDSEEAAVDFEDAFQTALVRVLIPVNAFMKLTLFFRMALTKHRTLSSPIA